MMHACLLRKPATEGIRAAHSPTGHSTQRHQSKTRDDARRKRAHPAWKFPRAFDSGYDGDVTRDSTGSAGGWGGFAVRFIHAQRLDLRHLTQQDRRGFSPVRPFFQCERKVFSSRQVLLYPHGKVWIGLQNKRLLASATHFHTFLVNAYTRPMPRKNTCSK